MDSFPKWEKPDWPELTVEKLEKMSHDDLYQLLLVMVQRTKQLPECPYKKFLIKLGSLCLSIQKLKMVHEEIEDEERKSQIREEVRRKLDEGLGILMKLAIMKKAEEFSNEVVEIEDDETVPDPWVGKCIACEKKPEQLEEEKNKVGEYDPWAVG